MKNSSNICAEWIVPVGYTPTDYHSFVYRLVWPDGRYYIGKKQLWTMRAGTISKASDWRCYWSSSKDVADLIAAAGKPNIRREVVTFCVSAGEASWQEMLALVGGMAPAVLDPKCLNRNVLMTFNRKVLEGYLDDDRREKYLKAIAKQKKGAGIV